MKVLRGNPSKVRLNEAEPKPPASEVVKPQMGPDAGMVWDRVAPVALAMGTLTAADVDGFKTFCQLQAKLDAPDVELAELLKTAATIRPYYGMFGLEPSARSRIKVSKPEQPASKWAGALA